MDRNKQTAQAFVVEVEVDTSADGGAVSLDQHSSPLPAAVDESVNPSLAAFGTTPFVPHTLTSPVNTDVFFLMRIAQV